MNDRITLRQIKDGQVFVELNAVLQKYLGRPSEKLVRQICKIVELIFDMAYNYEYILKDASAYDCSSIAGKKSIKQYDWHLLTEIMETLNKCLQEYDLCGHPEGTICDIIEIILESHGYTVKPNNEFFYNKVKV
jgi:hypothetical protein